MATIPNIMLAYLYQMNLFPIYKGLTNPSDSKIIKTAFASLFTCFVLYTMIGLFGYATFGNLVNDSNYLEVLANAGEWVPESLFVAMNGVFMVNIFCSMPFLFFGARNNFIAILEIVFFERDYEDEKQSYLLKESF